MCRLYNDAVDWNKCPPDIEDFPDYVHDALTLFNCLPDTYISTMDSPIYSGKDITALPVLFNVYSIRDCHYHRLLVFETIQFLDGRAREQALSERKKKGK
jgi:hypothetical protein